MVLDVPSHTRELHPESSGATNGGASPSDAAIWRYLRLWRELYGLSMAELTTRLKRSITTVARWERGDNPPGEAELAQLAAFYNVPVLALRYRPRSMEHVGRLRRAFQLIETMEGERADLWLNVGEQMLDPHGMREPEPDPPARRPRGRPKKNAT